MISAADSEVSYNTATGFAPAEPFATDIFPRVGKHDFQVVDIDGDGREDLISSRQVGHVKTSIEVQPEDARRVFDLLESCTT